MEILDSEALIGYQVPVQYSRCSGIDSVYFLQDRLVVNNSLRLRPTTSQLALSLYPRGVAQMLFHPDQLLYRIGRPRRSLASRFSNATVLAHLIVNELLYTTVIATLATSNQSKSRKEERRRYCICQLKSALRYQSTGLNRGMVQSHEGRQFPQA
jgi:hypothetical protein